jgi:C4-dicarboxylate transporter, DctM subunit
MTPFVIGIVGLAVMTLLLFLGTPIGIAMGVVGAAGFACIAGFDGMLGQLRTVPFTTFADYNFSVIPLFILMGLFCFAAGLSKNLFATVYAWFGHLKGGLAMATIGACAGFSAICGSSMATAVAMGTSALPEMKRYKYSDALATGAVAAGGTMGVLIPPSVAFVIYGIVTQQSIGKLFMAGIIPGALQAVFYMLTIYILCMINPDLGPAGARTTFREKVSSIRDSWVVVALFVLIMGGLYFGIFSATEAAGFGAFGAFFFGLVRRRLGWKGIKDSLLETAETTGMIILILLGAMIFNYFLAITRLPAELAAIIGSLTLNRYIVIVIILVLYLILGCLMDPNAMILITVPIFFPVIVSLGFHPIWFGVIVVRMCEIGMITPPVGLNVFIIKTVAKDVPIATIFRGIVPFLVADIVHVALLVAVPLFSLLLPGFMS